MLGPGFLPNFIAQQMTFAMIFQDVSFLPSILRVSLALTYYPAQTCNKFQTLYALPGASCRP